MEVKAIKEKNNKLIVERCINLSELEVLEGMEEKGIVKLERKLKEEYLILEIIEEFTIDRFFYYVGKNGKMYL